jgi:hypothetical protein
MYMARRSRASALCLSLLPALALGCGEDPVDANNQFTTSGNADEVGTDGGTADEVGTSDATDDATDDATSTTTSGNDDPTETDSGPTTDTSTTTTTDTTDTSDECETPTDQVGSSCGQSNGLKGPVAKGETLADLPVGQIDGLDNGLGNGEEDWYQIEFPIIPAAARPSAGTPSISFAVNADDDYRFEIYRDCGAEAYGQGLASEFGSNAPPLTEWSFNDVDPGMFEQLEYMEMVAWPATVWVRVFRFQNDGVCSDYQLQINRP